MGLRDLNAERVLGTPRTGVLAALIPDDGEHGPALGYTALLPEYAGKEVRVKITRMPSGGDLWVDEDSSFIYDGPSDSLEYVVLVNAAPTGETWLSGLSLGLSEVVPEDSTSLTESDSAQVSLFNTHYPAAEDSVSQPGSDTAGVLQLHTLTPFNCGSSTTSDTASVEAVAEYPTGLGGTPGQHSITWVWEALSGAAGYEIEYGPVGGPHVRADTGSVTSFEQTGLSGNTPYEARVRSYV